MFVSVTLVSTLIRRALVSTLMFGVYMRGLLDSYRSLKIHAGRRSDGMRTIAFTVVVCSVHFTGSGQMIIKQIQCVSGAQKQVCIFVAIANNTLYGSKLYFFIL